MPPPTLARRSLSLTLGPAGGDGNGAPAVGGLGRAARPFGLRGTEKGLGPDAGPRDGTAGRSFVGQTPLKRPSRDRRHFMLGRPRGAAGSFGLFRYGACSDGPRPVRVRRISCGDTLASQSIGSPSLVRRASDHQVPRPLGPGSPLGHSWPRPRGGRERPGGDWDGIGLALTGLASERGTGLTIELAKFRCFFGFNAQFWRIGSVPQPPFPPLGMQFPWLSPGNRLPGVVPFSQNASQVPYMSCPPSWSRDLPRLSEYQV